jgi:hypothetical protein
VTSGVNWDAIGALAELLGAVGVIASLVYLANQIRQNSQSVRAESVRQLLGQSSQMFMSATTSVEVVAAQVKARAGDDLGEEDSTRLMLLTMAILGNYENGFYQYRSGSLPEEIHASFRRRLSEQLRIPWFRETWDQFGDRFTTEFRSYVSELRDEASKPAV